MEKFYILMEIGGYWGVEASQIQYFLNQNKGKDVEIIINSPGGYVSEGIAIYNLLKNHDGNVTTRAVGEVASISSVIFLAGSTRIIETGAWLMIHKPWTGIAGDAEALRKEAAVLDTLQEAIENVYNEVFIGEADELSSLVDAETWLLADEAIAKGFATASEAPINAVASAVKHNLSNFKNIPQALLRDKPTNETPEAPKGTNKPQNSGTGDKPAANNNNTITEDTVMDITTMTADELLAQRPDLVEEIQAKAKAAEQERVAGIKALAKNVEGSPQQVIDAVNAKISTLCNDPKATEASATMALFKVAASAQTKVENGVGAGARNLAEDLDEVPADEGTEEEAKNQAKKAKIDGMAAGFNKKR